MSDDPAVEDSPLGVLVSCRVQPRAGRTRLVGRHAGAYKIRLAAAPVDGAANRELLSFCRELLDCPAGAVSLQSGEHGRNKILLVKGMTAVMVAAALSRATG